MTSKLLKDIQEMATNLAEKEMAKKLKKVTKDLENEMRKTKIKNENLKFLIDRFPEVYEAVKDRESWRFDDLTIFDVKLKDLKLVDISGGKYYYQAGMMEEGEYYIVDTKNKDIYYPSPRSWCC